MKIHPRTPYASQNFINLALLKKSITYAKVFRLLEGLIFAPLTALAGQVLRGQMVLDSTALVGFFLSPKGFCAIVIAAVSFLIIRMMEQAGLAVLGAEEFGGASFKPASALKYVLGRFLPLLRAAARIVVLALGMLAPLLVLTGLVARHLLSRHDINFYLAQRPSDFVVWGTVIAGTALATAVLIGWNAVRWRWVVHVILFENSAVGAAFQRSAQLTKGSAFRIALQWGAIGLLNVLLGTAAAWVGRLILPLGAGLLGQSITSLGVLLGCLLVLQALIGAMILMAGPIIEARIFTREYFKRAGRRFSGNKPPPPAQETAGMSSLVYAAAVLLLLIAGGVAGGIWGTEALSQERPVLVIAHRGAMMDAPENSMPAIERSIQDGADVVEIDVQLSRDGTVVLVHDRDFSRMGGVAKNVSDLAWDEIKAIDIGSGMGPQFKGVRVARLDEVLAAAKDRVRLNIEPKHYGPIDGKLEERVVELIRRHGATDQIEIQSLEYKVLMAVRRLEPSLKIGYLMSVNARDTAPLQVDFLSVQASRVDTRFLRQARKAGKLVYVWTVDEAKQMEKMIDLGVDGLITNQAQTASRVLRERNGLSPQDKALRRVRTWLAF